jgi:hypothetical protein
MEKFKGSETEAKPAKTSGAPTNTTELSVVNREVFVTPGISTVMPERPPAVRETYFQAMAAAVAVSQLAGHVPLSALTTEGRNHKRKRNTQREARECEPVKQHAGVS